MRRTHFNANAVGGFPDALPDNSWRPPTLNYPGNHGGLRADLGAPNRTTRRNPFGVFYSGSAIKMRDITDGSSNTFFVGERNMFCGAGTWLGARNPTGNGTHGNDYHLARIKIPLNFPLNGGNDNCTDGFSSAYESGAFFLFGDGKVKFISENINSDNLGLTDNNNEVNWPPSNTNLGVYQRLGMRKDGLPVGDF